MDDKPTDYIGAIEPPATMGEAEARQLFSKHGIRLGEWSEAYHTFAHCRIPAEAMHLLRAWGCGYSTLPARHCKED